MADLLVYNKSHWMDEPSKNQSAKNGYVNAQDQINAKSLSAGELTKELTLLDQKRDARHQGGDIVEGRPDGTGMSGKEPLAFALIQVTGLDVADVTAYTESKEDGAGVILFRRSARLDMTGIVLDAEQTARLTLAQFESRLQTK